MLKQSEAPAPGAVMLRGRHKSVEAKSSDGKENTTMKNTTMNITVCKEYTTIAQAPKVKEDIKAFKEAYTARDVLLHFVDALEAEGEVSTAAIVALQCGEVVRVTGDAFPGGTYYNDETHFGFDFTVQCGSQIILAHFYTDADLTFRLWSEPIPGFGRARLYRVERFISAEVWS